MLTIYVVKPFTQRHISFLLAVVCTLYCLPLRSIAAQEKSPAKKQGDTVARYGFSAYAAELALKVGHEAAGLSPVNEKIETELEAARILAPVRPSDALQLLDVAWSNINEWVNDEKSPDARRRSYLVSKLRGDVLALYAKLNAKRADELVKSLPAKTDEKDKTSEAEKSKDASMSVERQRADDLASVGLSKLEGNPSDGIETALSGIALTGKISGKLYLIPQGLKGNDALVQSFAGKLTALLARKTTTDVFDYLAIEKLFYGESRMPPAARVALVNFLLNSLQAVREKFALRALNKGLPNAKERQTDLAAAAVADISDAEIKSILQDYILMIQIEKLSKEKNYATAEDKAAAIMKPEWRAWTLMALGSGQPEQNRSAIIQLYNAAQDALGKSQPTPRRAELAFALADLWSGYDTNRAFEVIGIAIKYANQVIESDRQNEPPPAYLQGLFVSIGNLNFAGGLETGSLNEVEFQTGIERLARLNWLVADEAGRNIQNMNLRLRYQLAICKGALSARKADKKISRHQTNRHRSTSFINSGASA